MPDPPQRWDPSLVLEVPLTHRLKHEAERWRGSPRPTAIVTPGPDQESVWDYPRPPALLRVPERVEVFVGSTRIADSDRCLRVCETASPPTVYIPPDAILADVLVRERGHSMCEWKGGATYFGVRVDGQLHPQLAWTYAEPWPEYGALAGYVAFYPGRAARCVYGGQTVAPQPGHFYGGWVTPNLVGPFKGEPGSQGW